MIAAAASQPPVLHQDYATSDGGVGVGGEVENVKQEKAAERQARLRRAPCHRGELEHVMQQGADAAGGGIGKLEFLATNDRWARP